VPLNIGYNDNDNDDAVIIIIWCYNTTRIAFNLSQHIFALFVLKHAHVQVCYATVL